MIKELLASKPLVELYLKETPGQLACLSFVNIFVWQDFFEFFFEEIDGNLCIFAADSAGAFLYLPPLGRTISPKALTHCFKRMQQLNKAGSLTRIENVSSQQLAYFPSSQYKIYKKGYEYLYYRRDLTKFKGNAYKSLRHALNHFKREVSFSYCPYEISMAQSCQELYALWQDDKRLSLKEEIDLALLEDNRVVHRRVLEDFESLDLVGRVVEVEGKIVAYTFGYFIGSQTFCVLLEIADKKYQGLATYIFNQLCQDPVIEKVKFINVMDDFALGNVNRTKMSFRPSVLLPVYTVSLLR